MLADEIMSVITPQISIPYEVNTVSNAYAEDSIESSLLCLCKEEIGRDWIGKFTEGQLTIMNVGQCPC